MKSVRAVYCFIAIILIHNLFFTACKKEDNNTNPGDINSNTENKIIALGTRYGLYIINEENQTKILGNDSLSIYSDVQWSPNKSLIIFSAYKAGTGIQIYSIKPDGSNLIQLINSNISMPNLSPDGKKIAYMDYIYPNSNIYVMNSDGTNKVKLITTYSSCYFQWSSDSKKILYEGYSEGLNFINIDGTGKKVLNTYYYKCIQLSKNNDKILVGPDEPYKGDIETIDISDALSQPVSLTSSGNDYTPQWSPDETKIVFASRRDNNEEIYIMDADGRNQKRLLITSDYEYSPKWSADGKKILFRSKNGSHDDLFTIDPNGENLSQLTNNNSGNYINSFDW
jgi:TolB protein